ncbi:shikimate kinase [Sphingomonas sp. AP4-R1]|uniref:shikimate kinase n=1 Tax=Sphingomonas sp. AP4-R1 TaxID=2735134 RepID=UPI00149361C6|nr:shikimate kinase [Sphingomonas sp. AP4-R1]QJU59725.1 shikimate kinase [Sphingomonas sp. AP4-R1]
MIEIIERTPVRPARTLLLIGPGGAGKSMLGVQLAPLLGRALIDLDHEFLGRIGDISTFIRDAGYASYKTRNAQLAGEIICEITTPAVLVASSGFMTPDNPPLALEANRALLASTYSICLLPTRSLETSASIIVERQLTRPFSSGRFREDARIRARYPVYAKLGDAIIFSTAPAIEIAKAVARFLHGRI